MHPLRHSFTRLCTLSSPSARDIYGNRKPRRLVHQHMRVALKATRLFSTRYSFCLITPAFLFRKQGLSHPRVAAMALETTSRAFSVPERHEWERIKNVVRKLYVTEKRGMTRDHLVPTPSQAQHLVRHCGLAAV